jgi:hypothetical protein
MFGVWTWLLHIKYNVSTNWTNHFSFYLLIMLVNILLVWVNWANLIEMNNHLRRCLLFCLYNFIELHNKVICNFFYDENSEWEDVALEEFKNFRALIKIITFTPSKSTNRTQTQDLLNLRSNFLSLDQPLKLK